jgi:hypothetical protein
MANQSGYDQGVLNRISAYITFTAPPGNPFGTALDVAAGSLGKEGIRMAFEGNATDYFPTMTGAVPSPVPYQICTVTVNLLKTQNLGNAYQNAFYTNTLLGMATIHPDVPAAGSALSQTGTSNAGIAPYTVFNCVLESVRDMTFSGEDPLFVVTLKGYVQMNAILFAS